jgi:2-oxoacid:acceptor oxidoreductase delta subunit (pyruvate/2-ketoisovalerate family)
VAADHAGQSAADDPDTGKRVLIVGAGPSGLSAAYHLRMLGHQVTLRDSALWAGGMMRFGIPAYRLPRDILDAEVRRILAMGVTWEGGQQVTDIEAAMADGGFDAAFPAVGAQRGKRAYIPAGDSARILDAVTLLHSMEGAERPQLGRRVAVYGGGNTAMDAARTARRLGATDAVVVYRRTRDRMAAHAIEVEEAAGEGVRMMWLSTIARAGEGKLTMEKMTLDAGNEQVPPPAHSNVAAARVTPAATATPTPRLADFSRLNTWYYSDAPATVRPQLDAARRISTFGEVTGGLDESTAVFEARRCMSCGNCFECDNCYGVCPDNAVINLGPGRRYEIDLDYCKGCGICAAECPCGAIDMVPEQI